MCVYPTRRLLHMFRLFEVGNSGIHCHRHVSQSRVCVWNMGGDEEAWGKA